MSPRLRTSATTLAVLTGATVAFVISLGALPDITRSRLPGAAGGGDTYQVTAQFTDVLDLVPNSTVRVADVPVGRVSSIDVVQTTTGYVAETTLEIDVDTDLPAGTTATIRNTSLLGEKYVALIAPERGSGSLEETGVIPASRTTQDVEVEQILASVGALLNGGGLQQLSIISRELSSAFGGREDETRALLGNLESIMEGLSSGRSEIVAALDSAARLNEILAAQHDVLRTAIRDFEPATGVLAQQEETLTRGLRRLERLGIKATPLIQRSADATVADLEALAPVLRELGKVADRLPESLTLLSTYPLADNAVRAFSGAYGGIRGTLTISLEDLLATVIPTEQQSEPPTADETPDPGPGEDTTPQLPVPGVVDVVGDLLDLLGGLTGGTP